MITSVDNYSNPFTVQFCRSCNSSSVLSFPTDVDLDVGVKGVNFNPAKGKPKVTMREIQDVLQAHSKEQGTFSVQIDVKTKEMFCRRINEWKDHNCTSGNQKATISQRNTSSETSRGDLFKEFFGL